LSPGSPGDFFYLRKRTAIVQLVLIFKPMNIHLTDHESRAGLQPFTCTRSVADIRIGILTIWEKWQHLIQRYSDFPDSISMPAHLIPNLDNASALVSLASTGKGFHSSTAFSLLHPWQIFQYNDQALKDDFLLLTQGRCSEPISATNRYSGNHQLFLEPGASMEHCIINTSAGPVYIGKNALVMEGCLIRGPVAICENATVKMGTKLYGATTIGPHCVVGGEIKNAVLFGYSNKAHDGYLGDSVIGEWCNLGAGTSNSNVKNNAGMVSYRIEEDGERFPAGTKCGLLMGDYSRAAINSSFNTGSVVGVCCNIFGETLTPAYTNHFTWGRSRYNFENAIRDINKWMAMKGKQLNENDIHMLKQLFDQTNNSSNA
jgi:hypothetical protein